jgi:hypothetical protein
VSGHPPTDFELGKRHLEDGFIDSVKSTAAKVLVVSVLAIALCMFFESMRGRVFHSLLVGATFYLSITLGALWFVVLHHVSRAGWSVAVRRVAEGISMNTLWLWILFALFLIPGLAHWTDMHPWPTHFASAGHHAEASEHAGADDHAAGADDHGAIGHDSPAAEAHVGDAPAAGGHAPSKFDGPNTIHAEASHSKGWWLSGLPFAVRIALYFLLWIGIGFWYFKTSLQQDESGDHELSRKMLARSPLAMIAFAITVCMAGFDLLMALDPAWYSTIFGVYFFSGCVVSFFASLILFLYLFQRQGLIPDVSIEHYHDVGKYMFAFIVFWTYIAFSQFMLQWYGNLPEETIWYLHRAEGGWLLVFSWLLVGHFVLPFLLLMSRFPKRHPHLLALGAIWVLAVHYIDLFWLVLPTAPSLHGKVAFPLLDFALFLGLGAIYVVATLSILKGKSLIPEKDPRLAESLAFENF